MKIALMTNNYKPVMGGVPISIERLAEGLRALGHSVTIFAPTYEEQQEENNVFRYATLTKHFVGGIVLPNPLDLRIEKEFKRQDFDLIHVHHPMLIGRTAVYLAEKYHIPLVFTYHTRYEEYLSYVKVIAAMERCAKQDEGMASELSTDCLHLLKDKLMPAYLTAFFKHCDFILAPTAGIERYLKEVCRIPEDKLGILPTGLQRTQFLAGEQEKQKLREKYGAEGKALFITVSRMSHEKNVAFLLESLARLKSSCSKDFKMLMVGEGPERNYYEHLSIKLGLRDNVTFTGTVPNKETPVYFGAADAFLFASKTETQGIVVLEAFAGEAPVLAVEASGVSDLVRSGYNGILTEEDAESYAKVLQNFLEGKYDTLSFEKNALQTALEYREEAVALRAAHYYNKVTDRSVKIGKERDGVRSMRTQERREG